MHGSGEPYCACAISIFDLFACRFALGKSRDCWFLASLQVTEAARSLVLVTSVMLLLRARMRLS